MAGICYQNNVTATVSNRFFINGFLDEYFEELKKQDITYLAMLGNDDLLAADEMFDNLCDRFENVCNIAGRKFSVNGYEFIGMNYILDHPFGCKDRVVTETHYIPQRQLSPVAGISNAVDYDRIYNWLEYSRIVAVSLDTDLTGTEIYGIPIVADQKDVVEFACGEWIDEVFIPPCDENEYPDQLVDAFIEMGITVHTGITKSGARPSGRRQVEKIGTYIVITTSMNYADSSKLTVKRMMDIAGGLVGCLITLLIMITVGPVIYINSPGPIFFSQERIGRNGRKFKMYKFRSMYMDAEARKKELMSQNKISDGMMFKLDFDPRIIGNKLLPDGRKKTGIGQFIRKTSLDEFPQFFNVLMGDMSLVGTRPPTLDEWEQYKPHHRARMAFRPGLTGMWQVSGRSNITDFEEVVKLDTEYINEWSLRLDLKILWKTVVGVFRNDGAM